MLRRARFLREARALSKLEHPGICRIYDYIEAEDQDYLVLELIEGEPLSELLKNGPLERVKALRIAEQLADALNTAHAEGMLHRDLKPANVMLTYDGEAKILDFGLARSIDEQIRPHSIRGVVHHASSERRRRDSDVRRNEHDDISRLAHSRRHGDRNAALHESGASAWRSPHTGERPLLVRTSAPRDADREAGLSRRPE